MPTKEKIKMLEGLVKDINPKAFLHHADARCGCMYSIAIKEDGKIIDLTHFLHPDVWEQVLHFSIHDELQKIKNA